MPNINSGQPHETVKYFQSLTPDTGLVTPLAITTKDWIKASARAIQEDEESGVLPKVLADLKRNRKSCKPKRKE